MSSFKKMLAKEERKRKGSILKGDFKEYLDNCMKLFQDNMKGDKKYSTLDKDCAKRDECAKASKETTVI